MNTALPTATAPTPASPSIAAHGLAGRALAIILGLALPTGFLAWVLGFDTIKKQVNGRLWCSGADDFVLDVQVRSSGNRQNITDTLLCREEGAVVRTVGDIQMMATNVGVAFCISLLLFGLLVGGLAIYGTLRRRRSTGRPGESIVVG